MVPAGDHRHPRRQVPHLGGEEEEEEKEEVKVEDGEEEEVEIPHHVVGRHAHPGLVEVKGEVLLDDLGAGGDGGVGAGERGGGGEMDK